jgi:hypothetical protein
MSSGKRYTNEFKIEAVKQVTKKKIYTTREEAKREIFNFI